MGSTCLTNCLKLDSSMTRCDIFFLFGRDHRPCCARTGVPPLCQELCSGNVNIFTNIFIFKIFFMIFLFIFYQGDRHQLQVLPLSELHESAEQARTRYIKTWNNYFKPDICPVSLDKNLSQYNLNPDTFPCVRTDSTAQLAWSC